MSIYIPQYTEVETTSMPNCMCGDKGRCRNERECNRQGGCGGCGFDRDEHERRLAILREKGMQPITPGRRASLVKEWGVSSRIELSGLRIGKKAT